MVLTCNTSTVPGSGFLYSIMVARRQQGFIQLDRRRGAVISLDIDKLKACEEMKQDMRIALAKGCCKNVTREEAHRIVDELFDEYTSG